MKFPRFLLGGRTEPQPVIRTDHRLAFRSTEASDALAKRMFEIAGRTDAWGKDGELSIPIPDGPHDVHISELMISLWDRSGESGLAAKHATATRVVFERA